MGLKTARSVFAGSLCGIAALFSLALASCGGGNGAPSMLPASVPHSAPPAAGRAKIVIFVSGDLHIAAKPAASKRPRYISAATKSVAITIRPQVGTGSKKFNSNLTPNSPNCAPSPLVCTIVVSLVPGKYVAAIATYDGVLNSNKNPTGKELSANQNVPITITSSGTASTNITLGGIPKTVLFVPSPGSKLAGNPATGFTLTRCAAGVQSVNVFGLDADGNIILGAGAPSVTLASNNAQLAVATPSPASPNTFKLTPPAPPSYASFGGLATLTAQVVPSASSGAATIGKAVKVTFSSDVCGVFTEFPVPTSSSGPFGIVAGPDGAVWFTEYSGAKIGRIPTTATVASPQITEYPVPTAASGPMQIASGPDGALWFTECAASQIGRIPTSGSPIFEFATPTHASFPQGITQGADGAMWFAESSGNKIGRIPTSGPIAITEYAVPTASSQPFSIVAGPSSTLWFAEPGANQIGTLPLAGSPVTEYPVPTHASATKVLALGGDGALWFTENTTGKIGRILPGGAAYEFSLASAGAGPAGITAGPDGAIWFTEATGNKIGRIPLSGAPITELPIPTADSFSRRIVVGPDGSLWFTEFTANKIGRLQ